MGHFTVKNCSLNSLVFNIAFAFCPHLNIVHPWEEMSGKQIPLCLHFFHFLCISVSIQKQSRNDSPSQKPSQQWFWHLCKRGIEWYGVYGRDGVLGSREWYTEKSPLSPVLVYSMRERWNYGFDMDLIVERDLNWCQANSDLILALPLILIIPPLH